MASTSVASAVIVLALRLLDPRTGNVLSPAAVWIENGKIKEVGAPARVQADAHALRKLLMRWPPFWKTHGHCGHFDWCRA